MSAVSSDSVAAASRDRLATRSVARFAVLMLVAYVASKAAIPLPLDPTVAYLAMIVLGAMLLYRDPGAWRSWFQRGDGSNPTRVLVVGALLLLVVVWLHVLVERSYGPPADDFPSPSRALAELSLYVVLGPLVEEAYYRGAVHETLRELFDSPAILIITNATWFAFGHEFAAIGQAFVIGLYTTWLRTMGYRLWWCVAFHGAANLAALLL